MSKYVKTNGNNSIFPLCKWCQRQGQWPSRKHLHGVGCRGQRRSGNANAWVPTALPWLPFLCWALSLRSQTLWKVPTPPSCSDNLRWGHWSFSNLDPEQRNGSDTREEQVVSGEVGTSASLQGTRLTVSAFLHYVWSFSDGSGDTQNHYGDYSIQPSTWPRVST